MSNGMGSQAPAPMRRHGLALLGLLMGFALTAFGDFGALSTASAQDEPKKTEKPAAKKEGAPKAADTAADAPKNEESYLAWMIRASGVFGGLIFLLSFALVALIVMCGMQIRRDNFLPADFIEGFEQKLGAKDYQGAYELAKNDESFVGRVLAAGLGRLNRGYEEAVAGMQEVGEDENMHLEHKLSWLSLIGTIAPMLGLLGTVQGMIASFQVIATSATSPKPSDLADGIATALFTTMEGLVVAIPAMIAFSMFRNRVARYVLEVGMISEGLMSRFANLGKKPAGGAAPATAPAAPQA
jgi:biopolymer transport protein ExbB